MLQRRVDIITLMTHGRSDRWIARQSGHGRNLIRKVRESLDAHPHDLITLYHQLGAPRKMTPEVMGRIDRGRRKK
jgi:hypothetical protein